VKLVNKILNRKNLTTVFFIIKSPYCLNIKFFNPARQPF
jgi:hypothetical protein